MRHSAVVVVGGGILGAAVAYELAERGQRDVVVLESEPALNRHSTGRSAAYYIPMYESLAYASLAKASLPFLKNPPAGFSDRAIFSQDGALIAAIEGHAAGIKSEMAQAQSLGIEVRSAGAAGDSGVGADRAAGADRSRCLLSGGRRDRCKRAGASLRPGRRTARCKISAF